MSTSGLRAAVARAEADELAPASSGDSVALRRRLWQELGRVLGKRADARAAPRLLGPGALVRRLRAGDPAAFDELLEEHLGVLVAFAARQVGAADAEDVVQDALLALVAKRAEIPEVASLRAFLLGFVRHAALEAQRRAARRAVTAIEDVPEPSVDGAELAELLERERDERLAATLLVECDLLDREILLAFVEGRDAASIAAEHGLTTGCVRVRKHRAIERLRARLGGGS